jgi:hypothetical protein
MTQNLHLKGEKVFGSTKHHIDYPFEGENDSHRVDHVISLIFRWPFFLLKETRSMILMFVHYCLTCALNY